MSLRAFVVGFVLLFAGPPAIAQEVAPLPRVAVVVGIWEGPLRVGAFELRLAFTIQAKNGALTATMDSVDQEAHNIPVPTIAFADRKLTLAMPALRARFEGTMSESGDRISGTWEQGAKFPLTLKRVEKMSTLQRPQTPKKPYPYKTEDLTFKNADAKITLAGTLTLPKGDGPFPAVVLVSGSGPQDRDETLFGHKPFLILADHLTRQGVAVFRYDDRGTALSQGKHDTATTADFATDASAAVTFLKNRKEIDPKRIGIMGHSEGGMIAPIVAAKRPDDVAFIVLLAGPGLSGREILRTQQRAIIKVNGGTDKVADLMLKLLDILADITITDAPEAERKTKMRKAADDYIATLDGAIRKELEQGDIKKALVEKLCEPWQRYFLGFDPVPILRNVKCPVLAVNGELDLQVLHEANLQGIADALRAAKNERVTTKSFPGLNHLFQHAKTGSPSEYGQIEETFSPEVLDYVTKWIVGLK